MAISLTTDGLRLDYRTTVQTSVSGTYPIGTAIMPSGDDLTLPGKWAYYKRKTSWSNDHVEVGISATVAYNAIGIRVE